MLARLLVRPLPAVLTGLALLVWGGGPARAAVIDPFSGSDGEISNVFFSSIQMAEQTPGSALIPIVSTNANLASGGDSVTRPAFNDPGPYSAAIIGDVASLLTTASVTDQQPQLAGAESKGWPAADDTGTFALMVTGSGLPNLSAAGLIAALSVKGSADLVERVRGFNDGVSDMDVVKLLSIPQPQPPAKDNAVPAPPGVVLAGVGLGCLLVRRLRTRRAVTVARV
ncbi:MAG: hypothetical protein J0I06_00055 [Planctomycetes bacterium]|nr:hypothetical protein [Planctomycetota bacterium]